MSRFRSLRFRFAALCLLAVLVTTATLLTVMHTQVRQLVEDTTSVLIQSAESETAKVTRDVYTMCQVVHEGLLNQVDTNLRVERHQLEQLGGVSFDRAEVAWTALEQGTRAEVALRLPKMMIGGKWLGQNREPTVPTPWVDEVQKALGGTVTVFQRMNERGDMLRVATTVVDSGGKRAIGTYLAAQGTDGEANPVIAAILSGNSYRGRAFVVNDWYITGYEPLLDSANRVIGMLYAGVKQEIPLRSVRKAITSIVVGKTGYVWAVGGKGDKKGHYFVSLNGARDGEDVHEMKDAEGNLVIQQLIAQGLATRNGSINYQRYQWLNPGEKAPRQKLAAVTYFEPWDWVIGAGTYEDDFTTTLQRVTDVVASITRWSLVSALMILLAVVAAMMIVLRRLAKPLDQLVHASEAVASGDLTQSLDVEGADEVGKVAKAFGRMTANLRQIAQGMHESVGALNDAVTTLGASAAEQNQAITRQAAALQETQVTAQEIKQTSLMAAQKAEAVLQGTSRADEASRAGEKAIEQTMAGLVEVREQVDAIALKIKDLGGKTRQVGTITGSVKDLADQSNMLALNAAIEAVRSGEHGKGFGVVAREVRTLADQSIQATERVREILQDVSDAIVVAVSISEKGVEKMEGGLGQARSSGENLHQLASIIQENLAAVRQISAAVSQQNAGIGQIFTAVTDQNKMMEETVRRLEMTNSTVKTLREVSEKVSRLASAYRV